MSSTTTPNMGLILPTVGSEPSPTWATDLNGDMSAIDQHNHSSGQGVPIQPNGMSINADLPFNNNNITTVRAARFAAQTVPIPNTGSDVGELYVSGNELYYNDVTGANQVQITTNGTVNATSSGISSGSASAAFAGGALVVKSSVTSGANVEMQSAVLTNNGNLTNTLTLQAPTLSTSVVETLPSVPASVTSIMRMDTSGNMSANLTADGTSIQIIANQLVATTQLSAASQPEVNTGTNSTKFISPLTLQARNNAVVFDTAGTYTWTAPAGISLVTVFGRGGAGGGGSGTSLTTAANAAGGGGGGGSVSYPMIFQVTPGTQYTVIVGAGGAGGAAAVGNPSNGNAGSNGSTSNFSGVSFFNVGLGGAGGVQGGSGAGGSTSFNPVAGSGGAGSNSTATAGGNSITSTGGGAGTGNGAGSGGGGGGGAGDGAGAHGGNGGIPAQAGNDGSNGGGGAGSGGTNGSVSGAGGNGSPGKIVIVYGNAYTSNTNT